MKDRLLGRITDVQRASIHDGPGMRTTVFFKGCPLRCEWCHNPECIDFEIQELRYPDKCIGCGMCEQGCFAGARVTCGRDVTAEELMEELLEDEVYYAGGGGVTFSGGEPLMQREFLLEMLRKCKEKKIHRAIETSLIRFDREVFSNLDLVMADLKIWDSDLHLKYTGVRNEQIKENFKRLNELGIPVIARTPIISEIEQGIKEISAFLLDMENVIRYELLPYHPLGIEKGRALGKACARFCVPDREKMEELNKYAFVR